MRIRRRHAPSGCLATTAPFPNNIIPRNLLNPVSLNILTSKNGSPLPEGGFIPLPNFDDQARATNSTLNYCRHQRPGAE